MIKFIGILFLAFGLMSCRAQNKSNRIFPLLDDSAKAIILSQVNFKSYMDKEIKDFLLADPIKYYKKSELYESKPYSLSGISLYYSEDLYIEISAFNLKYQEMERLDSNWDIELYKKEKISKITLWYNDKVVKEEIRGVGK